MQNKNLQYIQRLVLSILLLIEYLKIMKNYKKAAKKLATSYIALTEGIKP